MKRCYYYLFFISAVFVFSAVMPTGAGAQAKAPLSISGKVFNGVSGQPVELGTVIVLEARKKVYTSAKGEYSIALPAAGTYTVIVRADELKMINTKINITQSVNRDFYLQPVRMSGQGITITGERDVQKVSRYTMTQKNLKEVPGSFGDSVNALTSLPGVIRTDGLFGPLVIRGANPNSNRYFIDDIPIYNPTHFGGVHSVINNNLMSEVDLYASAFPAEFGSAEAAVININTVDDVKAFGGYTDIGLISASALIQAPILRDERGDLHFGGPLSAPDQERSYQIAGYTIASGRIGYLSVFIPPIYEAITGKRPAFVPEYWDYQLKTKYFFNSRNSITLLLMGSADYLKFDDSNANWVDPENGDDPLLAGIQMTVNWKSHSQGLYYTWQPNDRIINRVIAYAALIQYYTYMNLPSEGVADWMRDLNIDSRPYIFGIKDRFKVEPVKDHLQFTGGAEYTFYYFTAKGKTIVNNRSIEDFDPADPTQFSIFELDEDTHNHSVAGFLQAKFMFGGLTLSPGGRVERFERTGQTVADPRGMASYEFPTKTTISVAGGQYSSFIQLNPFLFNIWPQVAKIDDEWIKPERAIHRVVGIEQKVGSLTFKTEGFYNTFNDLAESYYHYGPDGGPRLGMSVSRMKAHGFEIMLKRDLRENEEGLYGWMSYTYTRSRYRSGLPTTAGLYGDLRNQVGDPYGDQWVNFTYEQRHNLKLVSGYTFGSRNFRGKHTISCKFQYHSSTPYTPITGSVEDTNYATLNPGKHRHVPTYGTPYSEYYDPQHQLDIRYSYRTDYSWGYVSWYVEIINCYGQWYKPTDEQKWDYRYAYGSGNPTLRTQEGIRWIPNFGVEVKF